MGKNKVDRAVISNFIIKNIEKHQKEIVQMTAAEFNVSRQTVYRYIKELVDQHIVEIGDDEKTKPYKLKTAKHFVAFSLDQNQLDEEDVWRLHVKPLLPDLMPNVRDICHYGIGEMVNNVLEHSGAQTLNMSISFNALEIEFWIRDDGIGIFNKIQQDFHLANKNHAILELAKGKLTSDPDRHSGEGIFFTSRMFDEYTLMSEDLSYVRSANGDWLFPDRKQFTQGTVVLMSIEKGSNRTMKEIFDQFTPEMDSENFGFQKTIIPLTLLQYEGESLVSRSQAKRLIARFDQFREVILDFKGITIIGQPFADEVFRVFQNQHPNTHLYTINTNEDIERMIKLVKDKA